MVMRADEVAADVGSQTSSSCASASKDSARIIFFSGVDADGTFFFTGALVVAGSVASGTMLGATVDDKAAFCTGAFVVSCCVVESSIMLGATLGIATGTGAVLTAEGLLAANASGTNAWYWSSKNTNSARAET